MMDKKRRIDFLMICETTQQIPFGNEMKIGIISPTMMYKVPFIPTQLSFSVVCGISTTDKEPLPDLFIRFESPKGEIINNIETPIIIPSFKRKASIVTGFDVRNMAVHDEGEYLIKCYIGEELLYTQTLDVYTEEKE
jgi:hypothetical protein